YDSQGNRRLLEFNYEKTADNEWEVEVTYEGTSIAGPIAMEFDEDGLLIAPAPATITTTAQTINGAELNSLDISIGGSTQLGADFEVSDGEIDGKAASKVTGY